MNESERVNSNQDWMWALEEMDAEFKGETI